MEYAAWLALRPKRKAIEAAFSALGMPHTGWMNEVPTFRSGYEPDWEEIEKIALTVDTTPPPTPKPKPVTKPSVIKKLVEKVTPKKAPPKKGAK